MLQKWVRCAGASVALGVCLFGAGPHASATTVTSLRQSDEHIDSFDADYRLDSGRISVLERIVFTAAPLRHGLERKLPSTFGVSSLSSATMDGQLVASSIGNQSGETTIRLGDPNATIQGPHTFELRYYLGVSLSQLAAGTSLDFDPVGRSWPFPVRHIHIRILVPGVNLACASSSCTIAPTDGGSQAIDAELPPEGFPLTITNAGAPLGSAGTTRISTIPAPVGSATVISNRQTGVYIPPQIWVIGGLALMAATSTLTVRLLRGRPRQMPHHAAVQPPQVKVDAFDESGSARFDPPDPGVRWSHHPGRFPGPFGGPFEGAISSMGPHDAAMTSGGPSSQPDPPAPPSSGGGADLGGGGGAW